MPDGTDGYRVAAVTPPPGVRWFGSNPYNEALDFLAGQAGPIAGEVGVAVEGPQPPPATLTDHLSPRAITLLERFDAVADKSHPHPLDLERWRAFLIQAHRDRTSPPLEVISQWLRDRHWGDRADELAGQLTHSGELLAQYDGGEDE